MAGVRTSRSNSSGPASGKSRKERIFMPFPASVLGGIASLSSSSFSIARWAGAWNAQFLDPCVRVSYT